MPCIIHINKIHAVKHSHSSSQKVAHPLYWLNMIDDRLPLTKIVIPSLLFFLFPIFIIILFRCIRVIFHSLTSTYGHFLTTSCTFLYEKLKGKEKMREEENDDKMTPKMALPATTVWSFWTKFPVQGFSLEEVLFGFSLALRRVLRQGERSFSYGSNSS